MKRHNFKNLKIWQEGIELTKITYEVIRSFPTSEKFSLSSQIIRAAISIPSNIAEGTSKSSNKHFSNFIEHSLGSAFEWETHLIIARDQNYINEEKYQYLIDKIHQLQKMISGFKESLTIKS